MKKVMEYVEANYMKDPVIFGWLNMKQRTNMNDEEAVIHLIKALMNSKNLALRALGNRTKKDAKVLEFTRNK